MQKEEFTIVVYTENQVGMLHKVSILFTRRNINIDSLTVSKSEISGIHRYTIVIQNNEMNVRKICKQLEKQVDVAKAFYYRPDELVSQEMALYKIATSSLSEDNIEEIVRTHQARIISVTPEYLVIEKTGMTDEIDNLTEALKSFYILEYISSGRIAISKRMKELKSYLDELGTTEQHVLNL